MEFSNIEILKVPDVAKIRFKKIHKDYLKVLLLTTTIVFVLLVILLLFLVFALDEIASFRFLNYVYWLVGIGFGVVVTWMVIGFSRRKYAIREKDVTYKSGVVIKTITTVPFSRIQHVEINEAPISRIFKLASLNVFTAGDSSNDLVIKGIKKEVAVNIKEFINHQINE